MFFFFFVGYLGWRFLIRILLPFGRDSSFMPEPVQIQPNYLSLLPSSHLQHILELLWLILFLSIQYRIYYFYLYSNKIEN